LYRTAGIEIGTVYNEFRIERVDPAGLTISYIPMLRAGMEKVQFNLLPDDWQRVMGTIREGAKFNLEQKQAMAQLRSR